MKKIVLWITPYSEMTKKLQEARPLVKALTALSCTRLMCANLQCSMENGKSLKYNC